MENPEKTMVVVSAALEKMINHLKENEAYGETNSVVVEDNEYGTCKASIILTILR
jgi:hypothetical protein